jgi:hypothetical protein
MKSRRRAFWIAGVVILAASIGVGGWLISGRTQVSAQQIGERVPNEGFEHVPIGTATAYRAHPPASGMHYPVPAQTGVYPEGLAPGFWIHSLEHGYIVLLFKAPADEKMLTEFREVVQGFPKSKFGNVKLVIAPYADMPHSFAVLAWDWRLWLDSFDQAKVLAFYGTHVDHGREDLP